MWEFLPLDEVARFDDRWFAMVGYAPDELPQSYATWRSLLHPDDLAVAEPIILQTIQDGGDFTQEFRMKTKDGSWIWVQSIGKTIATNDDGVSTRMLGTHIDITERVLREAEVEKRASELETVAEVSTASSTILEPDKLLTQVVELTKANFGLYHAHIYLLNEAGDTLVLAAGAGEPGAQMVAQGWQIAANSETSLVARAARTHEGVIVNDVQEAPDFLANPLLPDTRSELAVPLIAGERVLGVLDVQSDEVGHFTQQDITIQTTLAGQIATALQNAQFVDEVAESQRMLQTVMNSLPESIFWKSKDLVYLGCNTNFARDAGFDSPDDVIGKTDYEMPWQEQAELYRSDDSTVMQVGEAKIDYEEPQTTPDGTTTWLRTSKVPLYDANDKVYAVLGAYADITEIKATQQEIVESQRMLQTVMNSLPESIFWKSKDLVYLGCNANFAEDTGFESPEAVIGKTDFDMPWGEQAELYRADDSEVMQTGKAKIDFEEPQTTPDGSMIWLRTSKVPLTDANDEVYAVLGAYADVTQEKEAQAALQENEERLGLALEAAESAVWEFQPLDEIARFDERWYAMVGYGPDEMEQSYATWRSLLHPDDLAVAEPLILQTIGEGGDFSEEFRMQAKDGGLIWIQSIGKTITTNDDGASTRMLGTHTDITERRAAEDALRETAERLREVDVLKSEFLANMSHELRTPLNSIIGYTQLLLMDLEGSIDEDSYTDMQAIETNSQHLLNLINDVLDLAKIEAGRLELNKEEVEVDVLLDTVKNSNAGLFLDSDVAFDSKLRTNSRQIKADQIRITQVLNNLISNAAKFTEEGSVTVRGFRENGNVCIAVKDTGIGISQEDLDTIFERFRQVDGSYARRAEGTGLGLPITRHLVEMHGGTLDVDSTIGEGSVFTVRLPILTEDTVENDRLTQHTVEDKNANCALYDRSYSAQFARRALSSTINDRNQIYRRINRVNTSSGPKRPRILAVDDTPSNLRMLKIDAGIGRLRHHRSPRWRRSARTRPRTATRPDHHRRHYAADGWHQPHEGAARPRRHAGDPHPDGHLPSRDEGQAQGACKPGPTTSSASRLSPSNYGRACAHSCASNAFTMNWRPRTSSWNAC